jgi:hypothetical protein
MSPRTAKSKKAPKGKTGKQQVLPPATPLDVKAVGKEIGLMVTSVDKAAVAYDTLATPLQARLIEIALHYPKQVREVLKHTGLSRARNAELLDVAEGRKTLKQIRANNAERQRRSRATRKAKAALPAPPMSVTVTDKDKATIGSNGNSTDPEASADERRAANATAAEDADGEDAETKAEAGTEGEEATETAEESTAEETAEESTAKATEEATTTTATEEATTTTAAETATAEKPEPKPAAKSARSGSAAKPKPAIPSKKALAEFRVAVNSWVPLITDADDRQAALDHTRNAVLLMGAQTEFAA